VAHAPSLHAAGVTNGFSIGDVTRLQSVVGNQAVARLIAQAPGGPSGASIQRYISEAYFTGTWRQANDLSTATKTGYPNHELYARRGKVGEANTALAAVNSGVSLIETTTEAKFWVGSRLMPKKEATLVKVEAKNNENGSQGNTMQLYADCGQSAAVVAGGSDRRAVYAMGGATKRTGTGDPSKLKIVIMRHWLDLELVKKNTPSTMDAHDRIQAAINAAEALEAELPALRDKIRSASAGPDKELARAEFDEKVDDIAEAYWGYYRSLSSTEKVAVDQSLKINASAVPKVGQGYTISTGGASVPGVSQWNFHWGGVVMKSDDGSDTIVLENYATGDPAEQNALWTFETYGSLDPAQSFHAQHLATGQHGQSPTTMTFENKP
jgi:hypothetical protein